MTENAQAIIAGVFLLAALVAAFAFMFDRPRNAVNPERRKLRRMTRFLGISRKSAKKQLRRIPNAERGDFRK